MTRLLQKQAFIGASWLGVFKLFSQIISWIVTILIARILLPDDYGLSAMATIITSYAEIFSELGLGASIIQKSGQTKKELSSVFWFAFFVSIFFALLCFPFSYITAEIFNEDRIIPLTQAVSILFIFSGLQIVPLNILKKEMNFKMVGMIELKSTIISCLGMLIIAYMGGGVWALIGGRIIRGFVRLLLVYNAAKWYPLMHMDFREAKQYIKFGITVAVGTSLFYIFENSDKYFAGRVWPIKDLGYYLFAMQLAQIPTEKIVVLINQVSYSVFSKLQHDKEQFNKFYLNLIKIAATIVLPMFICGYLIGEEIVKVVLGEKWMPSAYLFKNLCLVQIATSLNAINNFVHMSQGYPKRGMFYNALLAVFMSISFYLVVDHGMNAILYPWFTTYIIMSVIWIYYTINKLGINVYKYIKNITIPIAGILLMLVTHEFICAVILPGDINENYFLLLKIFSLTIVYLCFVYIFDNELIKGIKKLRK